jgi:hypothetical protein
MRFHHGNASSNELVDIGFLNTFVPPLISGLILYLVFPEAGRRCIGWKNTFQ